MIGQTLGNYRIIEQIGMGGMATVYKAYDPGTDRDVAIKILPRQFSQDPTFLERFRREAKAIAKLEHLHILPIFAYGEDEGVTYMAMRYLQAGTLTDRIKQGPLPLNETGHLLNQIAGALDYAHQHNILHRDVKPSNVLLDASGNAFLTDFGIAKMTESALDLTGGGILGTPAYMSPEQCRGNQELTSASDIYSLGIVLYEMITGRTPFQAETPIALIHMQLSDPLPLPRQLNPNLPEAVERVILKALAKEPEARYQTCSDMAAAFAQGIAGQPVADIATPSASTRVLPVDEPTMLHKAADETAAVPAPAKATSRRPGFALGMVLVALVVIGLGIGGAVLLLSNNGEEDPTDSVKSAAPTTTAVAPKTALPNSSSQAASPANVVLPDVRWTEPCMFAERGSGLCIFPANGGEPVEILKDTTFEDFGGQVAWNPDGTQIAFSARETASDNFSIYFVNADGSNLTELPLPGNAVNPAWSPDDEWLAFHLEGQLVMLRPDGSDLTILWDNQAGECAVVPQWSPDGLWIVVSMQVEPLDCQEGFPMTREVLVISQDGGDIISVATTTHENEDCMELVVAFSPDNQQVAYFDETCQPQLVDVHSVNEPTPLKEFPFQWTAGIFPQWWDEGGQESEGDSATDPAMSTEANKRIIAARCEDFDLEPGVCIHSLQDDSITRLFEGANLDPDRFGGQSWSPDGGQLVVSGAKPEDPTNDIYLVNNDGTDLIKLPLPGNAADPVWSPDWEWLAFHYDGQLAIVRPNGFDLTILRDNHDGGCTVSPQWSPDSRWIVASVQLEPVDCEGRFPITREVLIISRDGRDIVSVATITHENKECVDFTVAFSPRNGKVAYFDEACQPQLINADGSGESHPLEEFPYEWTAWVFPQW